MTHTTPEISKKSFNCPFCKAFSHFTWIPLVIHHGQGSFTNTGFTTGICSCCNKYTIWENNTAKIYSRMVWPRECSAPLPHEDMPDDVKIDFDEARIIHNSSPRGAAALLRLCIEKLVAFLVNDKKKKLDGNIAKLVKNGLPQKIQEACDIVRVTGNEAVHPGTMDLKDDPDTVEHLFALINIIVENQISEPKKIQEIFGKLPQPKLDGIKNRDK